MVPRKLTISNEYLEFLGEFEAIFETALASETGP
jgi:dsRNA-specific ribonuclease